MKKVLAILLALSVLALSACAAKQANSDTQKDSNTAETEQQPDSAQTAETQQPAQEAKRIEPLAESLDLNALTDATVAASFGAEDISEKEGGVDLTSDDSGVYYAVGLDDAKSYHELGRITVPVAEGFVLTDNADPEHPDETYAASDLAKLAASEPGFTANNTLATIEHGELTVLARSYTP